MKKLFCMLLALALCALPALAEEETIARAPGERLGFELLRALHAEGENCVLSPLSLSAALGMAAAGAEGETLEAMLGALEAESADALAALPPEGISSANAAFCGDIELRADYLQHIAEAFGAESFPAGEGAMEAINRWVSERTGGLIENFLTEEPELSEGLMLLNALSMDADWARPFLADATSEQVFHAASGETQVKMMHMREHLRYAEVDGAQLICLPYAQGALEMWILLPAAAGEGLDMAAALERLAGEGLGALMAGAQERYVALSLPKLDIACEQNLGDALCALGLEQIFSASADFSGISDEPLRISEVLQKVRVQLDEEGTRAAAATSLALAKASLVVEEPVEMRVDRPFLMAVVDGESGAVCFAGAVERPA